MIRSNLQTPFDEFSIALANFSVTFSSIHTAITIKIIEINAKVKYSLMSSFARIYSFLPAK